MKVLFVSLGCDKNRVDTEVMLGTLVSRGYEITDDEEQAEAAVINTCCFINDAKEESVNTILELAQRRKSGQLRALVVTGCLAQRYSEDMKREIPEVDEILGTSAIDKIGDALDRALAGERVGTYLEDLSRKLTGDQKRVQTTGGSYAYLKIAEGCNKNCTYCIIPKVRGTYRSVPMEQLVSEAEKLVENGVRELILVAQETTLYGVDLYGEKRLPQLLKKLCRIADLEWIRILYCYPEEITEELIQTIKTEEKICNYLDLPIQSGSDAVLKKMGRRTTNAEIRQRVQHLREEIPDICLRTTFITGFPGETVADMKQTKKLVEDLRFDRLGVFTYSPEDGTKAAEMSDQVPERTKRARRDRIMALQQDIAFDSAEAMIGRTVKAVIEGRITEDEETEDTGFTYLARTYKDAPDIDGYVFITDVPREMIAGEFVDVKITGADGYDVIGILA